MTSDDGEIIPPGKGGLPATRRDTPPAPIDNVQRAQTGGQRRTGMGSG